METPVELFDHVLDRTQVCFGRGSRAYHPLELEPDSGQLLPDIVVEIPSNPLTFLVDGSEERIGEGGPFVGSSCSLAFEFFLLRNIHDGGKEVPSRMQTRPAE
jgi:hypothetical protein